MVEDMCNSGSHHRQQRPRQPISVPFLWEEKPGTPKREWVSKAPPLISIPSPTRLVISVPFEWEEKPGKPLPHLLRPSPDPSPLPAPPWSVSSPSAYYTNPFVDAEDEGVFGLDLQAFASEMHKEASGLIPLLPILNESPSEESSNRYENWYSVSEADSQSNSSSSGSQNYGADASVLEFLFPLSSTDAGFLNEACGGNDNAPDALPELISEKSHGGDHSLLVRRTLTLGELILLSRKLSYRRKTIDVRKPRFSMWLQEFVGKNRFTCFPFGSQQQSRERTAAPESQQEVFWKSLPSFLRILNTKQVTSGKLFPKPGVEQCFD